MTPAFEIDHPAAHYSGDDWDQFIRNANRLTFRNIDNFRAKVTFRGFGVNVAGHYTRTAPPTHMAP